MKNFRYIWIAGLLVTLGEVLLPSVRRVSADRPPAT